MLYVGLDLSRKRIDFQALDGAGREVAAGAVPADRDGLERLVGGLGSGPVSAAIESMSGARFVHDQLELHGWEVEVADARRVKGLAPLACKTDRIDAHVLAELARLALVPAVWLPEPAVRAERELARFRLHLVRQRTRLKNRVHAALVTHGHPCPVSDLFGASGRRLLAQLELPEPWRATTETSIRLLDQLQAEIAAIERELQRQGADHRYIPLLRSCPGVGWVLGYTIAAEIGDIGRFGSPRKLIGYTGLCPAVHQSGSRDRRGPLRKNGPRYLRWALIEAASNAARQPLYRPHAEQLKQRLGHQRGAKVAHIDVARRLTHAIWHMLTRQVPFAPAGATQCLAA